ncbi:unnamed protein product [Protopolystoma xenopodis]|uniref:G-protein coupled receptors family 1 profile domain-containing protein n=1 Tax=Protopolystoma xenopodis TaxID=117903 RepID=A0A3S5A5E5_9PLAT|nr:unnamed protein product [Protopolystoma xenopodis]
MVYWFFVFLSVYNLMLIAVDRYFAVLQPVRYKSLKMCQANLCIFLLHVTSAVVNSVDIFQMNYNPVEKACESQVDYIAFFNVYGIAWFFIVYLIPVLTVFCLYGRVICHLSRGSEAAASTAKCQQRAATELTKSAVVITVIFVITFSYDSIYYLLGSLDVISYSFNTFEQTIGVFLVGLNSCANPLVYCLIMKSFRQRLVEAVCCFHRNRPRLIEPGSSGNIDFQNNNRITLFYNHQRISSHNTSSCIQNCLQLELNTALKKCKPFRRILTLPLSANGTKIEKRHAIAPNIPHVGFTKNMASIKARLKSILLCKRSTFTFRHTNKEEGNNKNQTSVKTSFTLSNDFTVNEYDYQSAEDDIPIRQEIKVHLQEINSALEIKECCRPCFANRKSINRTIQNPEINFESSEKSCLMLNCCRLPLILRRKSGHLQIGPQLQESPVPRAMSLERRSAAKSKLADELLLMVRKSGHSNTQIHKTESNWYDPSWSQTYCQHHQPSPEQTGEMWSNLSSICSASSFFTFALASSSSPTSSISSYSSPSIRFSASINPRQTCHSLFSHIKPIYAARLSRKNKLIKRRCSYGIQQVDPIRKIEKHGPEAVLSATNHSPLKSFSNVLSTCSHGKSKFEIKSSERATKELSLHADVPLKLDSEPDMRPFWKIMTRTVKSMDNRDNSSQSNVYIIESLSLPNQNSYQSNYETVTTIAPIPTCSSHLYNEANLSDKNQTDLLLRRSDSMMSTSDKMRKHQVQPASVFSSSGVVFVAGSMAYPRLTLD